VEKLKVFSKHHNGPISWNFKGNSLWNLCIFLITYLIGTVVFSCVTLGTRLARPLLVPEDCYINWWFLIDENEEQLHRLKERKYVMIWLRKPPKLRLWSPGHKWRCFSTKHSRWVRACEWNSILEVVKLGVLMICRPL
jgi:hypothetical protein